MATRALTPLARRRSRDHVSVRQALGRGRDWRQLLLGQDAEAIWHELSILVQKVDPDREGGYEQPTQDLFLHILTTDRISVYIEQNYSDTDIADDLVSILCK